MTLMPFDDLVVDKAKCDYCAYVCLSAEDAITVKGTLTLKK